MPDVRTFVALELPAPMRDAIALASSLAHVAPGKLSWVPEDNLHLTLVFLGATTPAQPAELARRFSQVAVRSRLALQLGEVGAFPNLRRPSVLWIGIAPSEALIRLQRDVDAACRELGFAIEERPFHPHITCARVKWPGKPDALAAGWTKVRVEPFAWTADSFSLMRSDAGPQGVRYAAIERFPLSQ